MKPDTTTRDGIHVHHGAETLELSRDGHRVRYIFWRLAEALADFRAEFPL